eukprot:gnl/TRDRNA2_/TRDRNA2_174528_c0_seq1.p2 gnl/TRDRNA2_/TRDRNA2_174528_c0~~gnl/TRDRNA2_/TRDRNA2_174528_c0_seq1.p2  ORF type:complete len:164 (-),score=42.30 gnl/TRDRNA2_/TRDRNA2_174528_c0_seq1:290-781(-)
MRTSKLRNITIPPEPAEMTGDVSAGRMTVTVREIMQVANEDRGKMIKIVAGPEAETLIVAVIAAIAVIAENGEGKVAIVVIAAETTEGEEVEKAMFKSAATFLKNDAAEPADPANAAAEAAAAAAYAAVVVDPPEPPKKVRKEFKKTQMYRRILQCSSRSSAS